MTHETAIALSADLTAAGISHTIQVGIYEKMVPQVQCRVDVVMPRILDGFLGAAIVEMEGIGARHGLVLHPPILGEGLTYSTKPQQGLLR